MFLLHPWDPRMKSHMLALSSVLAWSRRPWHRCQLCPILHLQLLDCPCCTGCMGPSQWMKLQWHDHDIQSTMCIKAITIVFKLLLISSLVLFCPLDLAEWDHTCQVESVHAYTPKQDRVMWSGGNSLYMKDWISKTPSAEKPRVNLHQMDWLCEH